MNNLLIKIINEIKASNELSCSIMKNDNTNEKILNILKQYELDDDEETLENNFGLAGLHAIRDAEAGMY